MTQYLSYALLIALVGSELFFILTKRYLASDDERRLAEASRYTIIDTTPNGENLW